MADKCGAENCGAEVIRATGPGLTSVMLHPAASPRGPMVAWKTGDGTWRARLYQAGDVIDKAKGEARYPLHITRCAAQAEVRKEQAGQAARARNRRGRRPSSPLPSLRAGFRIPPGGAA